MNDGETERSPFAVVISRETIEEFGRLHSEIERLRGLLRVCMRRWIPFKEVDFRRTVMEAAQCNENGDEP
jgi:hypothetical protein